MQVTMAAQKTTSTSFFQLLYFVFSVFKCCMFLEFIQHGQHVLYIGPQVKVWGEELASVFMSVEFVFVFFPLAPNFTL